MKLKPSHKEFLFSKKNFIFITTMHLLSIMCFFFFSWQALAWFLTLYVATATGVTFGFHRLLTHKAFKAHPIVENTFATLGTLSCQGGPISWVGGHRCHHAYSDTELDPHNARQGFWQAHLLWLFKRRQDLDRPEDYRTYAPDMMKKPFILFLDDHMILVQVILGITLLIIGGLTGQGSFDWAHAWANVCWGIFLRVVCVYHGTWLVNSAAHRWGYRTTETTDLATNNWWVALLAMGEGWHNNHHAQPRSARQGWEWYEIDFTWYIIKGLEKVGLISDIVYPKRVSDSPNPSTNNEQTSNGAGQSLVGIHHTSKAQ